MNIKEISSRLEIPFAKCLNCGQKIYDEMFFEVIENNLYYIANYNCCVKNSFICSKDIRATIMDSYQSSIVDSDKSISFIKNTTTFYSTLNVNSEHIGYLSYKQIKKLKNFQ